jgi:hypothetical protein
MSTLMLPGDDSGDPREEDAMALQLDPATQGHLDRSIHQFRQSRSLWSPKR